MPERFEIYIVYKRRYINTLPFLFPFLLGPASLRQPPENIWISSDVFAGQATASVASNYDCDAAK